MRIAANAVRVSQKSGGGFETYILNILNHLAKIQGEMDVYTLYPEHFPKVPEDHLIKIGGKFKRNAAQTVLAQATAPPPPRKFGLSGDQLRMLWTQAVFPLHLLRKKYDLYFASTHLDALPFSPIRQVINVQDTIPLVFPEQEHKYMFYIRNVLPRIYRRADKIIAVSENTKKDLVRFYDLKPENISVIYEAIDFELFKAPKNLEEARKKISALGLPPRYLLSVSSNLPHKNLPRMIEAYGLARKKFDIPLVVIGYLTAKYQDEISRIMKRHGLTDQNVRFLGHFSMELLPAVYALCEAFIFVSLYEGFGFPPLEALACGAPVVVSNAASIPEVVGPAGIYVDPAQTESIAQGIEDILSDEGKRKDLIRKGLEQAKKFSWEKAARETLEVFKTLV